MKYLFVGGPHHNTLAEVNPIWDKDKFVLPEVWKRINPGEEFKYYKRKLVSTYSQYSLISLISNGVVHRQLYIISGLSPEEEITLLKSIGLAI